MSGSRILVVEDDLDLLQLLCHHLVRAGFQAEQAVSGAQALQKARSSPPDLILLDLMLPGLDGLELCRLLKASPETAHIPIVMLTAKGEETDIVSGLELGADDYVTKPFSPKILLARIRAVLRRAPRRSTTPEGMLQIHNIIIDPHRHMVTVDGQTVELTATEFKILHFLASRPGWVFTRSQIVDAVHGMNRAVTDRAVDVQIVSLRRKLGTAGHYIETVRGIGYRLKE